MRPRIGPQPEPEQRSFKESLLERLPFGLGVRNKPRHYFEMIRAAVENIDNLPYAWRILRSGVCDGCSLGPRGLKDDVIDGVHLCNSRLNLLRVNTMGALDPDLVIDVDWLRQFNNEELQTMGRLSSPLIRRRDDMGFTPVSWEEALALAADKFRGIDPTRTAWFATSRGITNETYYVFQKVARILGSANVDYCGRMCHAPTYHGLKDTLGVGAPTCSLKDMIGTDLLVLWGSNLANNAPVAMKYLYHAKKAGTRVVVVNPYREPGLERYWVPSVPSSALLGTKLMDDYYPVAVGGDIAFINGILKALKERGGLRMSFVRHHTSGYEDMVKALDGLSWSSLEQASGLSKSDMLRFASIYSQADTAVFLFSMGLTQKRFGVENVRSIATLALSRGMIGREKCGIMPLQGHSGAPGGEDLGVAPDLFPSREAVSEANAKKLAAQWGAVVPGKTGLRTPRMIEAAHRGAIDFLYNIGGNLYETMPDRNFVAEAMNRLQVRIHNDIVLNTSTLMDSDLTIVLPATTRYEMAGGCTSTSTERRIRFSPEIAGPRIEDAWPEWEALVELAERIRPELKALFRYRDTQDIRDEMEQCVPLYKGIGNLLEEGDSFQWGGPLLHEGGEFESMPGNKARLWIQQVPKIEIPEGWFHLTTRRGKQFNSMLFNRTEPLTNGAGRNAVFMNEEDARELGVGDGDPVVVTSEIGEMEAILKVVPVRRRNVQAFWPEANILIPRRYDPISSEPDYNVFVQVRRATP